jgi:hypothetical protein
MGEVEGYYESKARCRDNLHPQEFPGYKEPSGQPRSQIPSDLLHARKFGGNWGADLARPALCLGHLFRGDKILRCAGREDHVYRGRSDFRVTYPRRGLLFALEPQRWRRNHLGQGVCSNGRFIGLDDGAASPPASGEMVEMKSFHLRIL